MSIVDIVIGWNDVAEVVAAARQLPPAEESYLETDFIMNLPETVLDYQMHTIADVRALGHFRDHRWDEIRILDDPTLADTDRRVKPSQGLRGPRSTGGRRDQKLSVSCFLVD